MALRLYVLLVLFLTVFAEIPNEFLTGNKRFSAKLYKELAKEHHNKNFVFCPINVQILLAAIRAASESATSETANEIRHVAELPSTKSETEQCFREVNEQLNQKYDDFKIFNAMKMYLDSYYNVKEWYIQLLKKTYGTEVEKIDFSNPNSVDDINDWVSRETNYKINNLFTPNSLSQKDAIVLIDALYLSGKWVFPFDEQKNEILPFHGLQSTVSATMMVRGNTDRDKTNYNYYESEKAQYLKLPLQGDFNEMVFVLPKTPNTLDDLEQQNVFDIDSQNYMNTEVLVKLPKFNITTDVKLKELLNKMGLNRGFMGIGTSDLSGLSRPANPYVKITDMFQKSTIEVTESGVTASSVAGSRSVADSVRDVDQAVFVADRPFLFYVLSGDLVIFSGRVVNLSGADPAPS